MRKTYLPMPDSMFVLNVLLEMLEIIYLDKCIKKRGRNRSITISSGESIRVTASDCFMFEGDDRECKVTVTFNVLRDGKNRFCVEKQKIFDVVIKEGSEEKKYHMLWDDQGWQLKQDYLLERADLVSST